MIGVGSHDPWQPTDVEWTLAELLGEQAAVALSNLRFLQEAEQRVEANRAAVRLLSHELHREPAKIDREVELLLEGKRGAISEEQVAALHCIQDWINAHQKLTDRLLDVNRFEAGTLSVTRHLQPIAPIVVETLAQIEDGSAETQIVIERKIAAPQLRHRADKTLVAVAVRELVRNALQYGASARIRVTVTEEGDHLWCRWRIKAPACQKNTAALSLNSTTWCVQGHQNGTSWQPWPGTLYGSGDHGVTRGQGDVRRYIHRWRPLHLDIPSGSQDLAMCTRCVGNRLIRRF